MHTGSHSLHLTRYKLLRYIMISVCIHAMEPPCWNELAAGAPVLTTDHRAYQA